MRVVVQRVSRASVSVNREKVGEIGSGLVLLIGIAKNDTLENIDFVADKCVNLRVFQDAQGKMNRSVLDENGEILAISQFTLLADTRKGRRPSFIDAAEPDRAEPLYNMFVEKLKSFNIQVACGIFGAMMDVELINQGPVTLIIEK